MSKTQFTWYSLSITAAVFLISIPTTLFPEVDSVWIEFMTTSGLLAFFISMIIKRGSFTDIVSEPLGLKRLKRFILLLGIIVLGFITGLYFQLMSIPIGRFGILVLFIVLWMLLLRDAWKKYKAVDA